MKNKKFLAPLFLILCVGLHAEDLDVNKFSAMQKFYYELGKEKAKNEYYSRGYYAATLKIKKLLQKYASKINRLEAGKYLIESSKMTFPEVYKTRSKSGEYQIHINPPKIEKTFSAEDLFYIPMVSGSEEARLARYSVQQENEMTDDISDSFFVPSMERSTREVSTPREITNQVFLDIKTKSSTVREFLDSYNSDYSSTESGYRVKFKNEAEKKKFCTDLTGETDCYGLI